MQPPNAWQHSNAMAILDHFGTNKRTIYRRTEIELFVLDFEHWKLKGLATLTDHILDSP